MAFLILCGGILAAPGADIYIAQTASGDGSGSGASNCMALATVNATWPASPGDTIHLVGTLANPLSIGGSGAVGKPITILFEPNAKFSATNWPVQWWGGGAITLYADNYITIDGGSNGLIEATANGTGLEYQTNAAGVGAASSSYLTVKNLRIRNLYVRNNNTDETGGWGQQPGNGVMDNPTIAPYYITGFTVSNCVISDCGNGINTSFSAGCSNFTFVANTMYRCNWGGGGGDRGAGSSLGNLLVARNHVYNFTNWDNPGNNFYHHNGFYFWADTPGVSINGVQYIGNTIGPGFGTTATSGMWIDGNATNVLVANNLILCASNEAPGNAMLQISMGGKVLNNTFIGGGTGIAITAGTTNWTTVVMGNLSVYCMPFANNYGTGTLIMDSNLVYSGAATVNYSFGVGGTGHFYSLSQIQTMGYDSHALNANPLLNPNGKLNGGSPAIGAGANFYSFFTTDFLGNSRPATGPWTIGAYQSPAPLVSLVASPTSVTNGQSSTLTWSSVNATNLTLSGFGLVAPNGSTNVYVFPTQITTYIATAVGTNGTFLASVSVTNLPSPPLMLRVIGYNSQ
jgi:hypothetical protein